jgi:hypothetical protein
MPVKHISLLKPITIMLQLIKKNSLLYVSVLLLLTACGNDKQTRVLLPAKAVTKFNTADTVPERFAVFFKRFNSDSVFRISRIIFPLKLTIIGGEDESDTTKFLQKKDLWFAHAQPEKNVIAKPEQTGKATANIHFFIEDTGFSVYYYFISRKGKWWMTSIRDESD